MDARWSQSLKTKMVWEAQKRGPVFCAAEHFCSVTDVGERTVLPDQVATAFSAFFAAFLRALCGLRFSLCPGRIPSTPPLLCYRFHVGGSSLVARKVHGRAGADVVWAESGGKSGQSPEAHRRGRRERCAGGLPARTFPDTVFLPAGRPRTF